MAPSSQVAKNVSNTSTAFAPRYATRSPGPTPSRRSAPAYRAVRSARWVEVSDRCGSSRAVRPGEIRARRAGQVPRPWFGPAVRFIAPPRRVRLGDLRSLDTKLPDIPSSLLRRDVGRFEPGSLGAGRGKRGEALLQ